MASKVLISSLVLIIGGLALLIFSDPQFRLIFNTSSGASGFPTTRFTFNGTFPGNFTGFRRTGLGAGTFGFNAMSIIESLLGTGLIGVGVVLIAIHMLTSPK